MATLCGPVIVWRRLYELLSIRASCVHPLELSLGIAAGLATPALAERIGVWAADHSQRQGRVMLRPDQGVSWSCTTLRQLLSSLSAEVAPHRPTAQVDHVVGGLPQARASTG